MRVLRSVVYGSTNRMYTLSCHENIVCPTIKCDAFWDPYGSQHGLYGPLQCEYTGQPPGGGEWGTHGKCG